MGGVLNVRKVWNGRGLAKRLGALLPFMSSGGGAASPFTSLQQRPKSLGVRAFSSTQCKAALAGSGRSGVLHSEVKGEEAEPPEDMSGAEHPAGLIPTRSSKVFQGAAHV